MMGIGMLVVAVFGVVICGLFIAAAVAVVWVIVQERKV
jgi:hypothetical protein